MAVILLDKAKLELIESVLP